MTDYRALFAAIEVALIGAGSQHLPEADIRAALDRYKQPAGWPVLDDDVYRLLVDVPFYAGFRAATVSDRLPIIHRHFPDPHTAAAYGEDDVRRILADPAMIRNRSKVHACIENARQLQALVREHGSFQAYVDTFAPLASQHNLLRLKRALQGRFHYLGPITAYHFLMEIGLPVLKPDRVICRIFYRLGLVEDESDAEAVVDQGRRLAAATGHPIRYVDIVLVAYGQVEFQEFGLETGICLSDRPRCHICGVRAYCGYNHP